MNENYAEKSFSIKYYRHLKIKKLFMKKVILNFKNPYIYNTQNTS